MPYRILVAEDSTQTSRQLKELLESDGTFQVDTVGDGRAASAALDRAGYSFLLTDLRMPGMDGMALIEHVRKAGLPVTVVVLTGHGSIDQAVQAMRLGATDFLTKPIDIDHLRIVMEKAVRERGLREELTQLRE